MDTIGVEDMAKYAALGEFGLSVALIPVAGVLLAAVETNANNLGLICPQANDAEPVWATGSLLALVDHFKGSQFVSPPLQATPKRGAVYPNLKDIKDQETTKRALGVAAVGGHNLLMIGPPSAGVVRCQSIASAAGRSRGAGGGRPRYPIRTLRATRR